jgi:hypothetical protein
MWANTTTELHNFAKNVNLRRSRYDIHPWPHYDVPEELFNSCVGAGAKIATRGERKEAFQNNRLTK